MEYYKYNWVLWNGSNFVNHYYIEVDEAEQETWVYRQLKKMCSNRAKDCYNCPKTIEEAERETERWLTQPKEVK